MAGLLLEDPLTNIDDLINNPQLLAHEIASEIGHPDAILVRSAKMHDMEIPASVLAIDPDDPAEQAYLAMLASRLKLDPALKASVGEEMTVREKNETRVEARKGGIVVRADEEYVSIRDHSDRHGVWMVLSREEALFVRDQIDAALAAGLVRP